MAHLTAAAPTVDPAPGGAAAGGGRRPLVRVPAGLGWVLGALLLLAAVLVPRPAAAQGVGQWVSPGPLAQDHADIEGITNCTKCHAPFLGVTTDRCVACHDSVAEQVRTKTGFHANKANKCGTCHPDHKGRDFPLTPGGGGRGGFELTPLQHEQETGFPLEGAHRTADCLDCHEQGNWAAVDPACTSCHDSPHGDPDHIELEPCDKCHDPAEWVTDEIAKVVFDHTNPKHTDYVLKGAHKDVGCTECHLDAQFVPTLFESCTSCHTDPHRAPKISNDCESCHTVEQWYVEGFDHDMTGFELQGLHGQLECAKCHKTNATRPIPHDDGCVSCHTDVHRGQFAPRTCDTCHSQTVADFRIPNFDHEQTQFPLVGEHSTVACAECHGEGPKAKYVPVAHDDCDACHEDVHQGKFEPTDCAACHVETGWGVAEFNHDRTDFPLRGHHQEVECEQCHPNEQWSGIAHDSCERCHDDHPHGTAFAPPECAECHVESDWVEVTFAHATETEFDLEPQHGAVACKECHPDMAAFAGNETGCRSCHADDTPAGHFEGECEECHRNDAWLPADLGGRSHDITGYALVGTHSRLACEDCHGTVWTPLSAGGSDCADCHADDDAHRHLLGDVCEDCHAPTTWLRTSFRHTTTGWPLRGAHRLAACDDCHAVRYVGTPDDCWRCHEAEAPRGIAAHQSAFFSQCDQCHRPYTWASLPDIATPTGRAR